MAIRIIRKIVEGLMTLATVFETQPDDEGESNEESETDFDLSDEGEEDEDEGEDSGGENIDSDDEDDDSEDEGDSEEGEDEGEESEDEGESEGEGSS